MKNIFKIMNSNKHTGDAIKSSYLGTLTNSHNLLKAVADHNVKMEKLVGKDYVRGTLNRYR